jgi:hypothetical protein
MKYFTIVLLLLTTFQVSGQKRGKPDPRDLKIDSLTKSSVVLNAKLDSTSKELEIYYGVYTTLKEKVFKYNFEPSKTSSLIDSLRTTRDSTFTQLSTTLKDSITFLKKENKILSATLDSLESGNNSNAELAKQDAEKTKAIADLKQLKELLDAKIITQEEFDTKKKKLLEKL